MKRNLSFSSANNSASLAHKCNEILELDGLAMKQNNSLGSMGLNPNLNIEDEYIENLLKQIHFMNLQIKLMKQKQSQSGSNALWGIINRANQPMVNNIVESNQKCQQMKKQTNYTLNKLQKDITRLQNDQGALQNELAFLKNKKKQIKTKQGGWQQQCKQRHLIIDSKITKNTQRLKNIQQQLQKQRKKNKQLIQCQTKTVSQDQSQKSKAQKQTIQIRNDQIIEEMIQKQLIGQIFTIKILKDNLVKMFEENVQYIQQKQQSKVLKQRANKIEQNIAGANFQIIQLTDSIKMAQLQRQKEIRQRKLLTEEYQQKKIMLIEIAILNQTRKQKQTINRSKQSNQIFKAQEQTIKFERSLQDIKKKLTKSDQNNFILSNEVGNLQRQVKKYQQTIKSIRQKLKSMRISNDSVACEIQSINNELLVTEDQYKKVLNEQTTTSIDLLELQRQVQYLRGRRQFLNKNMHLKDVINGLKIEDLQKVVQRNNALNSTVATLMTKWDQIKNFSIS